MSEERIIKGRIGLILETPFFGTLALKLKLQQDENIGTMGTDGEWLFYSDEFVSSLSDEELMFVLAHEVMHCALGHMWRRGTRNHKLFNMACDYAINDIIIDFIKTSSKNRYFKKPNDILYDSKYHNMAAEQIYEILLKNNNQNMNSNDNNGNDSSNSGTSTLDNHDVWNNANTQEDKNNKIKQWENSLISAAEVTLNKGDGTSSIERLINKLKKPIKNWKQLLAEFVEYENFDYGFNPPDKRYYGFSDLLLPDFNDQVEKIKDLIIVIDTSGSISQDELTMFLSELNGMLQQYNSLQGKIIFADMTIQNVYEFTSIEDILKVKPKGYGGTSFTPAIKYTMDKYYSNEWDVSGLIYFTDLEGDWQDKEVNKNTIPFKVLWIGTRKSRFVSEPDYGIVTYLKD